MPLLDEPGNGNRITVGMLNRKHSQRSRVIGAGHMQKGGDRDRQIF